MCVREGMMKCVLANSISLFINSLSKMLHSFLELILPCLYYRIPFNSIIFVLKIDRINWFKKGMPHLKRYSTLYFAYFEKIYGQGYIFWHFIPPPLFPYFFGFSFDKCQFYLISLLFQIFRGGGAYIPKYVSLVRKELI